ncbi:flagellar motor switch protein FliG [Hydrogenivirga sp. 128-5-R1-1]|uniref:flagellar motor switch protein FliG n=1 Tax=Hydrogenivirga sp. 128-5-R1-1 TaxID=392423 RepID=UPI00015F3640|nr:flagellar motor switch protein FliG [Hydrogenivirga sp. 128-5-R1-1]EDP76586.1 flagellar switch protein FliG [Hydrogenivirga sp. 128-5-R1-1]
MAEATGRELSRAEKAAVLLMSLPPDVAANILKELTEEEIQKIFLTAARIKDISPADIEAAVQEFLEDYSFVATQYSNLETLLEQLQGILPPEVYERIKSLLGSAGVAEGLEQLEKIDTRVLVGLIKNEHPQTIAVLLSQLSPRKASDILQWLPENLRFEVVKRIATLENVSPQFLRELIETVTEEIKALGISGGIKKQEGVAIAAELMNMLDKESAETLLRKIGEEDPTLEEKIREKMFTFEDIRKLDNRAIIEVLKAVDKNTLVIALKGAPDDIKEKFFSNMSKRAAKIMQEDMEALGPVKKSEVEKAQKQVVAIIRKLIDEGKIELGGEEAYV